jgi:protein TonB
MMTNDKIQIRASFKRMSIYFILSTVIFAFSCNLYGQNADEVFVVADEMPSFQGGQKTLMELIYKNISYPQDAMDNGIEGKVIVRFVINKEGKPTQISVSKGLCPSIDKVALDAINKIPKFIPGKIAGKPVSVWYAVPITFKLDR